MLSVFSKETLPPIKLTFTFFCPCFAKYFFDGKRTVGTTHTLHFPSYCLRVVHCIYFTNRIIATLTFDMLAISARTLPAPKTLM